MKLTHNGCAFEKHKVNMLYKHIRYLLMMENFKNC